MNITIAAERRNYSLRQTRPKSSRFMIYVESPGRIHYITHSSGEKEVRFKSVDSAKNYLKSKGYDLNDVRVFT